ncbi:antibiotic biosynthesis monooxygenase [Dehalobacter sp. DCM]|uniref:putative quinol monooxygenase n=1 Tax=Dehalobacter sp. DCM TaxID=2907827 RepID=UPI003081E05C|nr:antibiotic biosynthesis monooxygenase [Dehalobacter sp. DCM]
MAKTMAKAKANPERVDEFIAAVSELAVATRAEEGCIFYEMYQEIDEPTTFYFLEEWQSEADLQKHFNTPHFKTFITKMNGVEAGGAEPFHWKRVV